jgi:FMN phosphatase YigB (HAD superfamily)
MITMVIFDLDDTLYDEIKYCKSGFKAVILSIPPIL